ncbi:MAG: sporulation protein YqfD [Clostridia bacterium]|nr:sporulation protein YqfD [Clostridia bacterium]
MNNQVIFEVTASPETALKKLSKAEIAVYRLKKHGSRLSFAVDAEYYKKVFAIFSHPCYNTVIKKNSPKKRFFEFIKNRAGLLVGSLLFVAVSVFSGNTVLKIKVVGNGSYLAPQIIAIADECGAKEWTACRNLDTPLLQAKVMALPAVNFCSVRRDGAYLLIDVHTETEHTANADSGNLTSKVSGEIIRIVAICGTAERSAGERVEAGDTLIGAYELTEEGDKLNCLAVGFAEIAVKANVSLYYDCESEENTQSALKAAALYSQKILEKSYTVSPCDGGVKYEVSFTYVATAAINME